MSEVQKKRIVVLGGGFGGCFVAQRLEKLLKRDPTVEVSLVNRDNYFVFQPLLPEVAAGAIAWNHVLNPIRRMLPRTRFYASEVDSIDPEKREVSIVVGEGRRLHVLPYDHLVLALGTIVNLSGMPGMADHSLPMKNLGDAFYIRNHVLGRLEEADIEPDPALKKALCTFVVVGGGFSGVETIAEMHELVELVLPSYPNIRKEEVRFVLVHSQERILPEVVPGLADYAQQKLASRGIEFFLKVRCASATADAVNLSNGQRIPTRTLVCTVGNAPNPLLQTLPYKKDKGRVVTDATLAVPDHPGIWALGDCAWVPNKETGEPYAPTAQNAIRQAAQCAENIVATMRGCKSEPFVFGGLGKLASIGHRSAVAEFMGMHISGFLAWWMWRTVYLMKLPGFGRRVRVGLDWTLDLFFHRDIVQLKLGTTEKMDQAHYEKGEPIVKQGELGDKFYIIVQGEVEVVREEGGGGETHLATLEPGEYFGEVALLQDRPRTATVRALKPTDVLCIGRGDSAAVAKNFAILRSNFEETLKARSTPAAAAATK